MIKSQKLYNSLGVSREQKKMKECKVCKMEPWKFIPVDDVYDPRCPKCGKKLITNKEVLEK